MFGLGPFENTLAGDETCHPEKWMKVLEDWLDWDIVKCIPGHGPITDKKAIKEQLEFFKRLKKNVLNALQSGKTADEITFLDYYPLPPGFMNFIKTSCKYNQHQTIYLPAVVLTKMFKSL
ncbi:MAG: hypothetical protein JW969_08585 [Spirochaetales bacterium]|nr:hypothetical protein [Spirochaetales bacterium]